MRDGFLFIDKPAGPTSHDVVDVVRRLCKSQITNHKSLRVGHSGTLDPFATGLLIVGVGAATKEFRKLVGLDKEYEATLRLGAVSDTYDRTGKITQSNLKPQTSNLTQVLSVFVGTIEQVPPMYSAKKVGGRKLYELARAGIEIERKPSTVTIYSIELVNLNPKSYNLQLRIHCSSGTYIRSLAHDIGHTLGSGAYLEELRRTAIGPFRIEEAVPLAALTADTLTQQLKPVPEVLGRLPHATL